MADHPMPTVLIREMDGDGAIFLLPGERARFFDDLLTRAHATFMLDPGKWTLHFHFTGDSCDSPRIIASEWDDGAYFVEGFLKDGKMELFAHFELKKKRKGKKRRKTVPKSPKVDGQVGPVIKVHKDQKQKTKTGGVVYQVPVVKFPAPLFPGLLARSEVTARTQWKQSAISDQTGCGESPTSPSGFTSTGYNLSTDMAGHMRSPTMSPLTDLPRTPSPGLEKGPGAYQLPTPPNSAGLTFPANTFDAIGAQQTSAVSSTITTISNNQEIALRYGITKEILGDGIIIGHPHHHLCRDPFNRPAVMARAQGRHSVMFWVLKAHLRAYDGVYRTNALMQIAQTSIDFFPEWAIYGDLGAVKMEILAHIQGRVRMDGEELEGKKETEIIDLLNTDLED